MRSEHSHETTQRVILATMLEEAEHRVANDMAVAVAVLETCRRRNPDQAAMLDSAIDRLHALAASQRALRMPQPSLVTLEDLLERTIASVLKAHLSTPRVTVRIICDPITLNSNAGWRICSIVAELVTNALKHAFSDERDREGSILVTCGTKRGRLVLKVEDDGRGAAAWKSVTGGRGGGIVDRIAITLGGVVRRKSSGDGTAVTLEVPFEGVAGRRGMPDDRVKAHRRPG